MASIAGCTNLGFPNSDVSVSVVGLGGATLRPGNKCIRQLLHVANEIKPQVIYVHVGENDIGRLAPEQIEVELGSLVSDLFKSSCERVILCQLMPFPSFSETNFELLTDTNNTIKSGIGGTPMQLIMNNDLACGIHRHCCFCPTTVI